MMYKDYFFKKRNKSSFIRAVDKWISATLGISHLCYTHYSLNTNKVIHIKKP